MLSMRTRRFFQKTSRKITINRSDTAGYDKSKVECFNCHKMGHFTRECRGPRNQDSRNKNQDSFRRTVECRRDSSKAMVAIDGVGFDWSYMADDEVPTNMALMAFSDSEVHNDKTCSKTCLKSFETLKTQLDDLRIELNKSEFNLATYKRGLAFVEKQLVFYKKNEVIFCEQLAVLKRDISYKDSELSMLKNDKLEKKTVFPTVAKIIFIRPKQQDKPVLGIVKPKAVNTARPNLAVVNAVRENQVNAVKASARNGYVTKNLMEDMLHLGEEPKEEELLLKELLKPMCDKKNSVLFTKTGCFVLSPDFKLADESQVLLKVPRKNNVYSVDMKNIVPKECLTYLVAKATLDESMLWHRRLGHVNFKTINKLVKENLVRGLPLKCFENGQTCVACLKGKQHKASCKSKIQNSITQPLFMLHMDLFGPTFVSSLMNKKYYPVVTYDYSRFTWVFFLATKDETSGILKSFITEIENLVDKKVKIIRCDNGTEFKNKVTTNSKLPTTFLAEAVNTACYVHNRVLVVKPHNKTPYELFRGRTPALSFMRQFGCHVTIFNTLDYLGKFDRKSDEGFFARYSLNSKAFRVYNIRTRKVEENLHIRFLEDKPIIAGDGPKWLFDIDVLRKSMNYLPVVVGTNFNDLVGTEESIGTCHSSKETGSSQDYSLMPIWKDGSLFDSSLNNASNDEPQPFSDAGKKDDEDVDTAGPSINTASTNVNTGSLNINTVSPTVTTAPLETTHADFFGDETEIDMSNITTTYLVPSTLNTRIHKDHSLDHVISDVQSGRAQKGNLTIKRSKLDRSYARRAFAVQVTIGLDIGDLQHGKRPIGTKWVYMNKKDERGFEDPEFPNIVYKVENALYGLHQAPRAWYKTLSTYLLDNGFQRGLQVTQTDDGIFISQDKYVDEILKKFSFSIVKTTSTPMETSKLLLKDAEAEDVDVHLYRSMIGSLMYLTSLRPDIIHLKGQPKLGLWYPKDSLFDLEAYSDSDYDGATLDMKSTTGGCQFLKSILIS
ncbi:putative ribonuclease H-like domain-containing protein, partial [Tanacetum coccineum]